MTANLRQDFANRPAALADYARTMDQDERIDLLCDITEFEQRFGPSAEAEATRRWDRPGHQTFIQCLNMIRAIVTEPNRYKQYE